MSDAAWVFFGIIVVTLGGIVVEQIKNRKATGQAAGAAQVAAETIQTVRTDAAVTREQVANSHGTNLRDDLDEIRALVEPLAGQINGVWDAQRDIRGDIGGLRSEIRTERTERISIGARVTDLEKRPPTPT